VVQHKFTYLLTYIAYIAQLSSLSKISIKK